MYHSQGLPHPQPQPLSLLCLCMPCSNARVEKSLFLMTISAGKFPSLNCDKKPTDFRWNKVLTTKRKTVGILSVNNVFSDGKLDKYN